MNSIYLAAVVPDKHDPGEHTPYVATPIGPYRKDETAALERGRAILREMYATEDIRSVEPTSDVHDFDTARVMVQRVVGEEHRTLRLRMEAERAEAALTHVQPERWSIHITADVSGAVDDLDRVITMLGLEPGDV